MKKHSNITFLTLIILVTLGCLTSCGGSKKITLGSDLTLKEAYLQKVYPGQEDGEIRDYINISLEQFDQKTIIIDSIYCGGKVIKINNSQLIHKFAVNKGKAASNKKFTQTAKNTATLFYSKANKTFYLKIEGIKKRDDLYLP